MIGIIFLAGVVVGAVLTVIAHEWVNDRAARRWPALPPATARQRDRAARRNRADLSHVRAARELGVRVTSVRVLIPILPRLAEPPSFLPDVEAFDREPTRP